jgi:hypothetical protein
VANELTHFLADRDEPCPNCGYNLRGLTTAACPECRHELVLGVQVREPKHGPYITTVVGLACSAGFHLFLVLIVGYHMLSRGMRQQLEALYLLAAGLVMFALLTAAVRQRQRMGRWTHRRRVAVAALAWIVGVGTAWLTYVMLD